jgi:hypothetical protein
MFQDAWFMPWRACTSLLLTTVPALSRISRITGDVGAVSRLKTNAALPAAPRVVAGRGL